MQPKVLPVHELLRDVGVGAQAFDMLPMGDTSWENATLAVISKEKWPTVTRRVHSGANNRLPMMALQKASNTCTVFRCSRELRCRVGHS